MYKCPKCEKSKKVNVRGYSTSTVTGFYCSNCKITFQVFKGQYVISRSDKK